MVTRRRALQAMLSLAASGCAGRVRNDVPRPWTPPEEPYPAHPAVGSLREVPPRWRGALTFDPELVPLPQPRPGDYLAESPAEGQTFAEFVGSHPARPTRRRSRVYLVSLGRLGAAPAVGAIRDFVRRYFQIETDVLPDVPLESLWSRFRVGPNGHQSYYTYDIFRALERRTPPDAFATVGVTLVDLYAPYREFVFGRAHLKKRVAVCSFLRYTPRFRGRPDRGELGFRSRGLVAHELGHLFGLDHCVHFRCVLNGTAPDWQSDRRPVRLCPVCLRKLQWCGGLDPIRRYRELATHYDELGWSEERRWVLRRLHATVELSDRERVGD